jgi:c-di-GMP-related signal transduction protein
MLIIYMIRGKKSRTADIIITWISIEFSKTARDSHCFVNNADNRIIDLCPLMLLIMQKTIIILE